ncbi:MAG: DUF4115 domain-containing protein [Deltaproteobacteria bacterium]|nr:DUF4115 domain-containing protein [Deltaproteobacteria bacterium]
MEPETPEPAAPAGQSPFARLGTRLRAAREALGMSVRDVSDQTRVRVELLLALEEGRRADLPADVFVRGFVRSYARSVGLEMDALRHEVEQALGAPLAAAVTAETPVPPKLQANTALKLRRTQPFGAQRQARGRIAFLFFLLMIVGLVVVTRYVDLEGLAGRPVTPPAPSAPAPVIRPPEMAVTEEPAGPPVDAITGESADDAEAGQPATAQETPAEGIGQTEATAPAAPVVASPPAPAPAAAPQKPVLPRAPVVAGFGSRSVKVVTSGESWVLIYQDGKTVYERLMRSGEQLEFRFDGEAELTAGNPAAVTVTVDGRPAPAFRRYNNPSRIRLQGSAPVQPGTTGEAAPQ